MNTFKQDIYAQVKKGPTTKNDLIKFIYDYDHLILDDNDFVKPKRNHTVVGASEQCNEICISGKRCTRRHRPNSDFCGTHAR